MSDGIKKYIMNKTPNPVGEYSFGETTVYVKEPLSDNIDLQKTLNFVRNTLPKEFYQNVDMIYIGRFPFLISRQVDALFQDGAIYLTNQQDNEHNLLSDLVHEIAHSFEEINPEQIYEDGEIEREFLGKRMKLFQILKSNGFKVNEEQFRNMEFDVDFDRFLNNDIGYDVLSKFTNGLFISPYAATSLREYFANAFEEFFVNDMIKPQKLAPSVFSKIMNHLEF